MKKIGPLEYITGTLLLSGVCLLAYALLALNKKGIPLDKPIADNCSKVKEILVSDNYVPDFFKKGDKATVRLGGPNCRIIENGDLILFQISTQLEPVLRIVRGLPKDKFEVFLNKKQRRWNLKINGELLKFRDLAFSWGHNKAAPPLKSHQKEHKGIIPDGKFIMLSQIPPGSRDSGTFGLVNINQIIGIVQK